MTNRFIPTDKYDDSICVIDTVHHEVHEGHAYDFHVENLTPASGVTQYIQISSLTKSPHLDLEFEAIGGNCRFQIFENAVISTAGSVITINNRNRNKASVNSAITTVFQGSTVSTTGSSIANRLALGSSNVTGRVSSAIREGAERVWDINTNYVIGITPLAASMIWTLDAYLEEATL